MKKSYVLFLAFFSLLHAGFAQNDPAAKKVLDALSTKVKSYKTITTSFNIVQLSSKGKSLGSKTGNISVKGQMYLLKQGKTEVISDGNKTYSFDGSKTVTVTSADEAGQTLTPQKILAGAYEKDFNYKLVSSAGAYNQIELKPLDNRKNFEKVNIFIDKSKGMITKAVILDKSNNTLQITFSNFVTNTNLPDNLFLFSKDKYPKDVEVLD